MKIYFKYIHQERKSVGKNEPILELGKWEKRAT